MGLQGVYSNIFSVAARSTLRRGRAFDSPRRDIGLKGKDRTVVTDARGPSPGHSRQQDVEGRVGGRRPLSLLHDCATEGDSGSRAETSCQLSGNTGSSVSHSEVAAT